MNLSIIAAIGENNETGYRNGLLWHLPADLKRFKQLTTGHTVLMGRKTFESLPNGALPNRTNAIFSRDPDFSPPNCLIFSSFDKAIIKLSTEEEVYIIGGSQIYNQALPYVSKIYLTRVHAIFPEADTFFPKLDLTKWEKRSEETYPADENNSFSFTFYEYSIITY